EAQQRARELRREPDERLDGEREARGRRVDDAGPVAVDGGVQLQRARREEGVAATGAVADHTDLAGGAGQPAQVAGGTVDVADELLVADAALRAHERRRVVRARSGRLPRVQV